MAERRILCVFGTRPEAIKMVPVVRALAAHGPRLRPVVCVTDQHQEMLDQVLDFFGVTPAYRLGVMREGQSPSEVALAAFYDGVPVGHVEAGLRTYRKDAPFPEEVNRQLTTRLAEWHFAATSWARDNLLREHVAPEKIAVTGNPVIDALHWTLERLGSRRGAVLPGLERERRLVLVTAHRRESFGAPFRELCEALRELAERNPDVELVYPVHLNPEVQAPVRAVLAGSPRIHLLPPVDYWTLVDLLARSTLVLTDSGGIQEEAPSLGKPVLVLRETTERPEGIEAGTARLVGTSRARIVAEAERLLRDPALYAAMSTAHNPYGDGRAGERIAAVLAGALGGA